jgi:hypothetical protein
MRQPTENLAARSHLPTDRLCFEGENYVRGLISVSLYSTPVIGMEFLSFGGKALIWGSGGMVLMEENDLVETVQLVAKVAPG